MVLLGAARSTFAEAPDGPPPADVSISRASIETLGRKPTLSLSAPLLRATSVSDRVMPVVPTVTPPERPVPGAPAGPQADSPLTFTQKVALPPASKIVIPAVGIDTDIVEVAYEVLTIDGQSVMQGQGADDAASHDAASANPGERGNIVITGHDD